jgi:hypothetical protein
VTRWAGCSWSGGVELRAAVGCLPRHLLRPREGTPDPAAGSKMACGDAFWLAILARLRGRFVMRCVRTTRVRRRWDGKADSSPDEATFAFSEHSLDCDAGTGAEGSDASLEWSSCRGSAGATLDLCLHERHEHVAGAPTLNEYTIELGRLVGSSLSVGNEIDGGGGHVVIRPLTKRTSDCTELGCSCGPLLFSCAASEVVPGTRPCREEGADPVRSGLPLPSNLALKDEFQDSFDEFRGEPCEEHAVDLFSRDEIAHLR